MASMKPKLNENPDCWSWDTSSRTSKKPTCFGICIPTTIFRKLIFNHRIVPMDLPGGYFHHR